MKTKDNKVKVLLCSPYGKTVGGISRWTGHILNNYMQLENNNEIELIHYYKHSKGVYQNTSKFVRVFRGLYTYIPFLYGLKRKLKSDNFDIVHLTSSASFSLLRDILAVNIAKKRNVKSIIHFRFGRIPELYTLKNWEQKLLHTVITMADYAVVIDQKSYDTLLAFGYKNIKLLPNPLSPKVVDVISKHSTIKVENRKLLFAGHVVVTKGVFELIEACKTIPNIKLKMIGYVTEEMKLELQSRAGKGYHQWLDIVGEVDFETTIKEMLSTEIFVLPTYTEGFPNVIIESMACGCPIVTTNVGAIPEMLNVNGEEPCGLVVEPKNINQLRSAIIRMLEDRNYAIETGRNAKFRVEKKYSMDSVWNQLKFIWKSIENKKIK